MPSTLILKQTLRRKAFSIIELTVAVAILAVISSLVAINITTSRRAARDGLRKADAPALLTAVNQYVLANGSSFIAYPDSNNKPGTCVVDPSIATNPSISAIGNYCVGASGRSYGLVNVAAASGTTVTLTGVGVPSGTQRTYTGHSIVEALRAGGYLNVSPKDPQNKTGTIGYGDAGTVPDYALIRACPNGRQHVAKQGQLFAVWVVLENAPSSTDIATLGRVVGYKDATPDAGGYDFAAGSTLQAKFESNGYGTSNGASRPQDTSMAGVCTAPSA